MKSEGWDNWGRMWFEELEVVNSALLEGRRAAATGARGSSIGCSRRLPGATQRDYPPTQAAKTNVVGEGDASSRSREPLVDQVFRFAVRLR
jgi:hypothetical protein